VKKINFKFQDIAKRKNAKRIRTGGAAKSTPTPRSCAMHMVNGQGLLLVFQVVLVGKPYFYSLNLYVMMFYK